MYGMIRSLVVSNFSESIICNLRIINNQTAGKTNVSTNTKITQSDCCLKSKLPNKCGFEKIIAAVPKVGNNSG